MTYNKFEQTETQNSRLFRGDSWSTKTYPESHKFNVPVLYYCRTLKKPFKILLALLSSLWPFSLNAYISG